MTTSTVEFHKRSLLQRVLPTACAGLLVFTVVAITALVVEQRRQIAALKATLPQAIVLPESEAVVRETVIELNSAAKTDLATSLPLEDALPKAIAPPPDVLPLGHGKGLDNFQAALFALANGARTEPVTILHIGDSHIASDSLTRGLRQRFQHAFGDAGRGFIGPPDAYKYFFADGLKIEQTGWTGANSFAGAPGSFGLAGTRLTANTPGARMSVAAKTGRFDFIEVRLLRQPAGGIVRLSGAGASSQTDTGGESGIATVRLDGPLDQVEITPAGNGAVTILGITTGRSQNGVRYVNLGIPGATADVMRRWTPELVGADIESLNPDLIVIGYGTNEGFNAGLDPEAYRARLAGSLALLRDSAPGASWLFLGPADGASRSINAGLDCGGGWRVPPQLAAVRTAMQDLAREMQADYWDWSEAMGGPCSINRWASEGLAAADRVHLTKRGYDRSAEALYAHLMSGYSNHVQLVSAGAELPR